MNENKYSIRPIEEKDFYQLEEWWSHYKELGVYIPKKELLPNNGLGGCVVEKENKIIACAFLYFTNSALAYVDHLIADPYYREQDREYMLLKLAVYATTIAQESGYETVWAMTKNKKLIDMAERAGCFDISDDEYRIVYFKNTEH